MQMRVNPGELNKKIRIIRQDSEQDEYGCGELEPEVVRECWAKFSRTSGTENIKSGADMKDIKARFLVRYSKKEIDRKMKVRYAGETYEIEYINEYQDDKRYVEIWGRLLTNG